MRSLPPLKLLAAAALGLTVLAGLPTILFGGKNDASKTSDEATKARSREVAESLPRPSTPPPLAPSSSAALPVVAGTQIPARRYRGAVHHQPSRAVPRLAETGAAALFGGDQARQQLADARAAWRRRNTFSSQIDLRLEPDRRLWLNDVAVDEGASLAAWGEVRRFGWDRTGVTIDAAVYRPETDTIWQTRILILWDARSKSLRLTGTLSDPNSPARIELSAPLN